MSEKTKKVSMGFTEKPFPAGTHMCLIYDDDKERLDLIFKFLREGLVLEEKAGYFVDTMTPEEMHACLENMGLDFTKGDYSKQLDILKAEDVYFPKGEFYTQDMLETVKQYNQKSLDQGFSGSRVSGEMSWALKGIPGSDRLMEYESLLNNITLKHQVTAICQYDARSFDGKSLFDVLKVHPMMIVRGQVVNNPYYLKPEEFLKNQA